MYIYIKKKTILKMNAFICYITCIILLFAILSNYCYIINYSNNLFNVPNLFLGRLDVLFTNFKYDGDKKHSIGYTAVIVMLVIFNPFGI